MEIDNLVVFLDPVGRTIFAEKMPDRTPGSAEFIVKNPVVVHLSPKPDGQMALQLLPLFFREFLADKNGDVTFTYNKNTIAIADPMKFDEKLHTNYHNMFSNIEIVEAMPELPKGDKVVDLFDEKK